MRPVSRTWRLRSRAENLALWRDRLDLVRCRGRWRGAERAWWPLVAAAGVPRGIPVGRGSTPHGEMVSARRWTRLRRASTRTSDFEIPRWGRPQPITRAGAVRPSGFAPFETAEPRILDGAARVHFPPGESAGSAPATLLPAMGDRDGAPVRLCRPAAGGRCCALRNVD